MDDQLLIQRIQRRDQEAMFALHAHYADLIYSIAFRMLDDAATAEECVQDAFMKVWQSAAQFDGHRGPVVAWIIGIARNVAIDKLRHRGRRIQTNDDDNVDLADDDAKFSAPSDWQEGERVQQLRLAVQSLPTDQRQVIELGYYGGMSQAEISDQLHLPLGTVKTRMRLGMQKLRAAWLGDDENEE